MLAVAQDPLPLTATAVAGASQNLDPLEITATYIVRQVTYAGCITIVPVELDPLFLTATAIVQQAGAAANDNLDPLFLTATAIIQQATAQAVTPAS